MRKVKIVADSSANVLQLKNVAFAIAPLKVVASRAPFGYTLANLLHFRVSV